jgi:hypothetical protein
MIESTRLAIHATLGLQPLAAAQRPLAVTDARPPTAANAHACLRSATPTRVRRSHRSRCFSSCTIVRLASPKPYAAGLPATRACGWQRWLHSLVLGKPVQRDLSTRASTPHARPNGNAQRRRQLRSTCPHASTAWRSRQRSAIIVSSPAPTRPATAPPKGTRRRHGRAGRLGQARRHPVDVRVRLADAS